MSQRKSVYVIKDGRAPNPGVSPNAFVAKVTAEVRLFLPPYIENLEEAERLLTEAYEEARAELLSSGDDPSKWIRVVSHPGD